MGVTKGVESYGASLGRGMLPLFKNAEQIQAARKETFKYTRAVTVHFLSASQDNDFLVPSRAVPFTRPHLRVGRRFLSNGRLRQKAYGDKTLEKTRQKTPKGPPKHNLP